MRIVALMVLLSAPTLAIAETPAERVSRLLASSMIHDRPADAMRDQAPSRPRQFVNASLQPGAPAERPSR